MLRKGLVPRRNDGRNVLYIYRREKVKPQYIHQFWVLTDGSA